MYTMYSVWHIHQGVVHADGFDLTVTVPREARVRNETVSCRSLTTKANGAFW